MHDGQKCSGITHLAEMKRIFREDMEKTAAWVKKTFGTK